LPATDESLSPLSATSTPVSKSISGSTASRFSHPSRPTSDYMPRLDGSAGTSVVPATPGLARRLSMSISRRDSEQQVPLAVKPSPAVVIRDFAFSSSDPRYAGEGQPPPAPAPVRNSSGLWGPSTSSLARTPSGLGGSSWDDLASGEGAGGGLLSSGSSSTFSWGFVTSHAEAAAVDEISESMDEDDEDDQPVDVRPQRERRSGQIEMKRWNSSDRFQRAGRSLWRRTTLSPRRVRRCASRPARSSGSTSGASAVAMPPWWR
jgi:hypothetical protein